MIHRKLSSHYTMCEAHTVKVTVGLRTVDFSGNRENGVLGNITFTQILPSSFSLFCLLHIFAFCIDTWSISGVYSLHSLTHLFICSATAKPMLVFNGGQPSSGNIQSIEGHNIRSKPTHFRGMALRKGNTLRGTQCCLEIPTHPWFG